MEKCPEFLPVLLVTVLLTGVLEFVILVTVFLLTIVNSSPTHTNSNGYCMPKKISLVFHSNQTK